MFAEMKIKEPLLKGDSEIGQIFKIFQFTGTPTDMEWKGVEQLECYKHTFPSGIYMPKMILKIYKTHPSVFYLKPYKNTAKRSGKV